ncbi:MAG: UPF0104 family protein [Balneolaceae bacterium]|nr:MAG: UPF0104 family protein [Balneolaceae bacterium]
MKKRLLNTVLPVLFAAFFLWIAFGTVDLAELWNQIGEVTYGWLPGFIVMLLLSHFLRAERWRMLLPAQGKGISRITLFSAVMLGYFMNNFIPRLGEISRPVYLAKKEELNAGNLIGTIVAERIFDLLVMLALMFFSLIWLVSDPQLISQLLGVDTWNPFYSVLIPVVMALLLIFLWVFYRLLLFAENRISVRNAVLSGIVKFGRSFGEGMISLRRVNHWPKFLLYTAAIWLGYISMAYLPFYMLSLQEIYGLTFNDAVVLTVVSSVGVSVPTPGAIGSYHLLIQQSMWLLYEIPLARALTYATVVHAVTFISITLLTPFILWADKASGMKRS